MIVISQKTRQTAPFASRPAARYIRLAMMSVCLIALCRPSIGLVWTGGAQYFVMGHVYVGYTANWVPSAQGTLVDVTTEIVADDDRGHVNDLHGNVLTIDSSTNTVCDSNAQATGFVYAGAPR